MAAKRRPRRRASVAASFRAPTARARANWEALDHQQQLLAVTWAAEHLHRNAKHYFPHLGRDVLNVGSGYRVRGKGRGRRRRVIEEPVVTVVVAKKWTRKQILTQIRKHGRSVLAPDAIQLTVPVRAPRVRKRTQKAYREAYGKPKRRRRKAKTRARRLVLRLPVDVREPYNAVAQATQRARPPQQIHVTDRHGSAASQIDGTACALVQQASSTATTPQRYVLGCHHVIYRTLHLPPSRLDRNARAFVQTTPAPSPVQIGTAAGNATFSTTDLESIDAAVVKLDALGTQLTSASTFWRAGARPNDWVRDRQQLLSLITIPRVKIFLYPGARAHPTTPVKQLRYVTRHLAFPVSYPSGATVRNAEVIEFDVLNGTTVEGNSGAPVVCLGHFVGMHIAGNPERRLSFVLPAWLLMRPEQVLPGGLAFV